MRIHVFDKSTTRKRRVWLASRLLRHALLITTSIVHGVANAALGEAEAFAEIGVHHPAALLNIRTLFGAFKADGAAIDAFITGVAGVAVL